MKIATFKPDAKIFPCSHPTCTAIYQYAIQLGNHLKDNPTHRTPEQTERYELRQALKKKKKQTIASLTTAFCTQCGMQTAADWKFCGGCGAKRA